MHVPAALWSALVAATLCSAAPTPERPSKRKAVSIVGSRDFHLVRRSIAQHQAHVGAKFKKRSGPRQDSSSAHLNKRTAVQLHDLYAGLIDVAYFGSALIGSSAQQIPFNIDTGSADVWMAVACDSSCGTTPGFAASSSSTYRATTTPFAVNYNQGSVSGVLATDSVTLGGLTASNQVFGAVSHVSTDFQDLPSAGILGLGFSPISNIPGSSPLLDALHISVLGYRVVRNAGSGSTLDVNALDSRYNGSFQWTPLVSRTYWEVAATGLVVNGAVATAPFLAAIDTGTTLVHVPPKAADAFYAQIPGSHRLGDGSYTIPCDFSGSVGIQFSNTSVISISNQDLKMIDQGDGSCIGAVLASSVTDMSGQPMAIIGDTMLKNVYTAFDNANSRVGFATPL